MTVATESSSRKTSQSQQQHTYASIESLPFLNWTEPPPSAFHPSLQLLNAWRASADRREPEAMIHVTVPDTQVLVEAHDQTAKYTAFNVHVNGWYHAAVRFSQLHNFAETMKTKFNGRLKAPEFPPKKLFRNLEGRALDERRIKIGKYLQAIVQHPEIARHSYVEKTFLNFQIDSYRGASSAGVTLDIYLGDGERLPLKCNIQHSTEELMKLLCSELGGGERFSWCFGLFLARDRGGEMAARGGEHGAFPVTCVRLLRNFESPYVSLQLVNQKSAGKGVFHKILLRKLVFDPRVEEQLLDDAVFSRLLFKEARSAWRSGDVCVCRPDAEERLRALEGPAGNETAITHHAQFLHVCHQQPGYGMEYVDECMCERGKGGEGGQGERVKVRVGRRQLVFETQNGEQSIYRATRIRVWRISQPPSKEDPLVFQFEYLVAKERFEWITLHTPQAILLSLLLQLIGCEILFEHRSGSMESQFGHCEERTATTAAMESDWKRASLGAAPTQAERPASPSALSTRSIAHNSSSSSLASRGATSEPDPLGAIYESFSDVFTTITDVLPIDHSNTVITDDDL